MPSMRYNGLSELIVLLNAAELGAGRKFNRALTSDVAERMGMAQQSISRHMIALEQLGFIEKKADRRHRRTLARVTGEGRDAMYSFASDIFRAIGMRQQYGRRI